MLNTFKKYIFGSLLESETDTIKLANITVVFYITFVPICLLLVLQINYFFIGTMPQIIIGLISIIIFSSAMVVVKIKKDIYWVSHFLLAFSIFIFGLNSFLYPNSALINGLLLSCNIIFAYNFFSFKIGSVYSFICLFIGVLNLILLGLNVKIPIIVPIEQSLFEKTLAFILLFLMIVVLIIHYQQAHKKSAVKLMDSLKALKISEERRKKSQAVGLIGNWEYDITKNVLEWEEETYKIYGVSTAESKPLIEVIFELIHPDDLEYVISSMRLYHNQPIYKLEYRIVKPNNELRYLNVFAELVNDSNQVPIKFFGVVQDITDRKLAEFEQKKLLEITSLQNSKLKNFTYIVSHNIRSHSSNITSLLQFLTDKEFDSDTQEIISMLNKTSQNLESTLQNLNDIIRINEDASKNKTELFLKEETEKVLSVLAGEIIKNGIEINNLISPDVKIKVVPSYCESILLNLITNAIKYRASNRTPTIQMSAYQIDNFTVFEIKDNGLGIDMKKFGDKIFGMYKTFHQNEDSRGIGLFLTKNHIEAMDGKIEVESKVEVGTTFRVYFNDNFK